MDLSNFDWMILIRAFAIGGLICVIGQILIDTTKMTPAKILVLFVVLGVFLGGIGVYDKLVEWAGAGASVPLVGFGNLLAKGVRTGMESNGWVGIFTGGLTAAAGGVTAAVLFAYIASLVTKSSAK